MRVLITGGAGFLGQRLAEAILERGGFPADSGVDITLVDIATPAGRDVTLGGRARFIDGDIGDDAFIQSLVTGDDELIVFHLAAVVSATGEADFDLAMRVNLDAVRVLFEALRARTGPSRLLSTSSVAVYGSNAGRLAGDDTRQVPETTYGVTKAILELLATDYTRKGFLDARVARLPTVIIRPGAPNGAASSAASAVFREPLAGIDYALPVDPSTSITVSGVSTIIAGILALAEAPSEQIGVDRAVMLPSISVTFAEMIDAVRAEAPRLAPGITLGEITVQPDPHIQAIMDGWPAELVADRGDAMGLPKPGSLAEIIEDYLRQ